MAFVQMNLLSKSMKWKRKLCILIPVGCLLLLAIWYVRPISVNKEMTVCNLDGKTAEIRIEVSFYRHFFKENSIRGTLTWDGNEYLDEYSKWGKDPYSDDDSLQDAVFSAVSTLLHKNNENLPKMTFLNAELPLIESTLHPVMIIDARGGYNLEMLDILYHDSILDEDGNVTGIEYFGPANNQEEAQKIYQEFYKNYE